MKPNSGIALIAVMAALMVLSAIAIGLAASVQTEARIDAADFDGIQGEELARSAQEFALFLETRGLKKTPDFLAGLPFEAVTPGFHYRSDLPTGSVDIYFEADNGKIDLSAAPPELLTNFFAMWTGDFTKGQFITAAIEDWRDSDDIVRPNGAEAESYADLGYLPRNSGVGLADAPLIRGMSMDDFQLKVSRQNERTALREGLDAYLTPAATGSVINPNFAPEMVLRSIPGINESQVMAILSRRSQRPFDDPNDLQATIGLPSNAPAWRYLTLSRIGSAVSAIAQLKSTGFVHKERRVMFGFNGYNIATGLPELKSVLGRVQRGGISAPSSSP
jgi:general secretion pathway protein K